jgi:hypothetical protein
VLGADPGAGVDACHDAAEVRLPQESEGGAAGQDRDRVAVLVDDRAPADVALGDVALRLVGVVLCHGAASSSGTGATGSAAGVELVGFAGFFVVRRFFVAALPFFAGVAFFAFPGAGGLASAFGSGTFMPARRIGGALGYDENPMLSVPKT